jgi:outer membrane protein OmpA-like peptidoglycan-associated protein
MLPESHRREKRPFTLNSKAFIDAIPRSPSLYAWGFGIIAAIAIFASLITGASKTQEIDSLKTQLAGEQALTARLKNLLTQANEEQQTRRSAAAAPADANMAALTSELAQTVVERDKLRDQLATFSQERASLIPKLADLQGQRAQALEQLASMQTDTDERLTQERNRLTHKLAAMTEERDALLPRIAGLEAENVKAQNRLNELAVELKASKTNSPDIAVNELREQLEASQRQAQSAGELLTLVAQKLAVDLKSAGGDWAKPINAAGDTARSAIIKKLDQALAVQAAFDERVLSAAEKQPPATPPSPDKPIRLQEIHFSPNSAQLTPGAERKTKLAAEQFLQNKMSKIAVFGFSDTTGNDQYNLELSRQRAQTVAQLLTQAGIPRDKIEIVGKGENDLPEATPDGIDEPLNRCVGIMAIQ